MVAAPEDSGNKYRIGELLLDTGTRRVTRGGEELKLGALTFDFLLALAESAPSLVTYDDIAQRVWAGRRVSPETITQRAKMLRDALSDDAKSPRYFELIRGQGYRLVVDVEPVAAQEASPAPLQRGKTAVIMIAIVVFGFVAVSMLEHNVAPPSVAVLPFVDLSQAGDQQYLADGIAEELINALSGLDGLDVASRTESFYYPGPTADLEEVGKKLGVSAVLEGSVRKSGREIRITVQLIEVDSGYHLWSETFDRELEDVFAIQDDIAESVAGALGVKLGVGGVNAFRGAGTENFEAYEAYLRGDYEQALELDPNYAAAWARQGILIASTMWTNTPDESPEIIDRAYRHVVRAIELDPESAEANALFATLTYAKMDWIRAEQSYATALALSRDSPRLNSYSNMLMRAGRSRSSIAVQDERLALMRVPAWPSTMRINPLLATGQFDAARDIAADMTGDAGRFMRLVVALNEGTQENVRTALTGMRENSVAYTTIYEPLLDRLDDAESALAVLRDSANDTDTVWPSKYKTIAILAAYFGDPEFAFDVFSRELRNTTIRFGTLWYPVMTEVRRLPQFKDFLVQANLVDYWRAYGWSDFCRPLGHEDFVCD